MSKPQIGLKLASRQANKGTLEVTDINISERLLVKVISATVSWLPNVIGRVADANPGPSRKPFILQEKFLSAQLEASRHGSMRLRLDTTTH